MNLEGQIKYLLAEIQLLKNRISDLEVVAKRVDDLEVENKELRRRLNMNSRNSSKPPSSDSIFNKPQRELKKRNRKPGGQTGHKGNKLNKFKHVDHWVNHTLDYCPNCQSNKLELLETCSKQLIDLPIPKVEVTEHILHKYQCTCCGQLHRSDRAKDLKQEAQYGPNIKAFVNYLSVYQLIPYKRLTELMNNIFGIKISEGSISNFNKELSVKLTGFIDKMKTSMIGDKTVIHSDETGCIVDTSLYWMHVYCDKSRTLLQGHNKRGRQAMNDIGILPYKKGVLVHDRFTSYSGYTNIEHALCNAHIIRELKSALENVQIHWPASIIKLLLRAKEHKESGKLTVQKAKRLERKYESILRQQRSYYQQLEVQTKKIKKKGRLKRRPDHNLFIALTKHKHEVLKFMFDKNVPFDNNQAERDLRMFKVKMKISNQFKNDVWLNVHANIRSYISTLQKQGQNVLEGLQLAYLNPSQASILGV